MAWLRAAAFDDPVGLRLYLGACEGLETGDFARARAFAQQITAYRPDAPAGWACLANSTIFAEAGAGAVDPQVLARAESYAQRALAADPGSGLAYVALAMAASWRGDPVLKILERGLRADPDFAMLHRHYAQALSGAGMVSQVVVPALRAVALLPHDPGAYQFAVAALVDAGRTEEAMAMAARAQRLWHYDEGVEKQWLEMLAYASDPRAALTTAQASPMRKRPGMAAVFEALAWRAEPQAYDWSRFDRAARNAYASDPRTAWAFAFNAARMDDQERAFEWLARAPSDAFLAWTPMFAPEAAALRRDPRFFAKMAAVGLVARWQKAGRWPDFCADPALAYDCRKSAVRLARSSPHVR